MKIAQNIGLNSEETKYLLELVQVKLGEKSGLSKTLKDRKMPDSIKVEEDIFSVISKWYCFAILNLSECHDFRWSITWIAKRLGITPFQVKEAIEKMEKVGLLKRTKKGLKLSGEFF